MPRLRSLAALLLAAGASVLGPAAAAAAPSVAGPSAAGPSAAGPCQSGHAGFRATFWNPYDDWSAADTARELAAQREVGQTTVIADWSYDQDANAAWYPGNSIGADWFEPTIPTLVGATSAAHDTLWMGLLVAPDLFAADSTSASFLQGEVPRFEALADDLARHYGPAIHGWYLPTEPTQADVATPALARQYGSWLAEIDAYLHTHDGDKPVMIATVMPTAIYDGLTPAQYVAELAPMMAVAGIDVWDLEDGFDMTAWTPSEEAEGFALAERVAAADHTSVWADVYTPAYSTPAQWEPYLQAIAAAGTTTLSEWTAADAMDPSMSAAAAGDYAAYRAWCR